MDVYAYKIGSGRYLQGENILDLCGEEVARYGKKAYVIGGATAVAITKEKLEKSCAAHNVKMYCEVYNGYPSIKKIKELVQQLKKQKAEILIGVGGGRIMDLVKVIMSEMKIAVITIPTSAATCAAFTPLSVLYTDEGKIYGSRQLEESVNSVIVDEKIMLTQPGRLLAAGIADSMAKYIEITSTIKEELTEYTMIQTHSALMISKYLYEVLTKYGLCAVQDLQNKNLTIALKNVIFCNIAITGMVSALSHGSGQLAMGHALYNVIRTNYLKEAKHYLHGEIVAVGLLFQLSIDDREKEIQKLKDLYEKLELPSSLHEIGIIQEIMDLDLMEHSLKKYYSNRIPSSVIKKSLGNVS